MRMGWALAGLMATAACGSSAAAPASSTSPSTAARTSAATAGPPAHAACGPAKASTLAVNPSARVYMLGSNVYGCAGRNGHSYLLGTRKIGPGLERVAQVALGGVVTAYVGRRMGVDTVSAAVIVRRLDDGRLLHQVSASPAPVGAESFESVEALVVKPDGAVAWISDTGSVVRYTHSPEVVRLDRRGEAKLDGGLGIDPRTLRLHGSRLTWRNRRVLHSSLLQ